MNDLGRVIATLRVQRGYRTQQALADALGKTPTFVSRLERGAAKELPAPEDLHALADVLRVPEAQLLEAAGYRVIENHPQVGLLVADDDPRVAVVRLLADVPDDRIAVVAATLREMLPLLVDVAPPARRAPQSA